MARANLRASQNAVSARIVALYTSRGDASALEVLLGSSNLDDVLNRIDSANHVSDQDQRILREIRFFRKAVLRHELALRQARFEQVKLVARRAAEKASVERQLAQRQRYLASVKGQIAVLQRQEAERQARLAAQLRARLAAQRQIQDLQQSDPIGISATTPEGATVAPPSRYGGVVGIAMQFLGIPYRWGGSSPSTGFDCSGFVAYVYAQMGVSLPHNAAAQFAYGTPISKDELQPGDLVFFDGLGHNGIYVGNGEFIHSPHTGDVVKISSLSDPWYAAGWVGARRL